MRRIDHLDQIAAEQRAARRGILLTWIKTVLARCLGTAALRAGFDVLFSRADVLLKELAQARVDHTFEKTFRRFLAPDLLIVDDFGLRRLSAQQSQDLYELIIAPPTQQLRLHQQPRRGRMARSLR